MIRKLKIKFVCINMLIVTIQLMGIFCMLLSNTAWDMAVQSYRTIERIQNLPAGKAPPWGEIAESYFIVYASPRGDMETAAYGRFQEESPESLLRIGEEARTAGTQKGILKNRNLRYAQRITPAGEMTVFLDITMEGRVMKGLIQTCVKIYMVALILFLGVSIPLAQWAVAPVEKAWNTQRQFVADASHELKTPLTVIMTNAELLQDQNGAAPFTQNILTMSRQMRGLVEGLLDLARVDNGAGQNAFTVLDLSRLVERWILPFEPLFFEKGMALETDLEPGIPLSGSEDHLRQLVEILLDNALKYGSSDQPVRVTLRRQGSQLRLCVATAGEAMTPQELKNIFQRFYRIDKARTMNQSYGLGLSIAQGIVESHRGKIWAESREGINSFFVEIPAAKETSLP